MTTWDERKRLSNRTKHGVDFTELLFFNWEYAIFEEDNSEFYGEQREKATGPIGDAVHVYIYTLRNDAEDHAISLRRATRAEERKYAKELRAALGGRAR